MSLPTHGLNHVWVVQLEGRTFRADTWQGIEVVVRRRASRCPLERVAVTPRIINSDDLTVAPGLVHVPDERQEADTQDEGTNRGDLVEQREAVSVQVVSVAARHAHVA